MPPHQQRQKPRKEKVLPPLFEWGECPAGQPPVLWEHSARPLWVQAVPERDAVLLIEKERLVGRRISTGKELWTQDGTTMPDDLAADGGGIVVCSGAHARELDPVDGSQRWRQRPGGPISGVAVDERNAYLATNGPLFALNREDGKMRWRAPCSAEPELHVHPEAGLLVVEESDEELIRTYRTEEGELAWEFSAEDEPVAAGPVVNGVLVVSAHGAGAAAVDAETGEVRWQLETERAFEARGVALGERVFLTDGQLHAVEAATGAEIWTRVLEDPDDAIFSVRSGAGRLFAETWSGRLLCLDPADGALRWERRLGQVHGLTADEKAVYVRVSRDPEPGGWAALCLDGATGDLRWEVRSPKLIPDITPVGDRVVLELRTQLLVLQKS